MRQRITIQQIESVFAQSETQEDYLIGLYKLVLPKWDNIERLEGWPSCNEKLWKFICGLAADFDQKHHPNVLAGGAWLNSGFSSDKLPDWTVSLDSCKPVYKQAANA